MVDVVDFGRDVPEPVLLMRLGQHFGCVLCLGIALVAI